MKKLVLLLVCLAAFSVAQADVLWVCGDVSGVWSADTVMVTCEVRVPPGDTLIIEPGVKVLFWAYCKFIVDSGAVLHAVGTANDSILFDEYVLPNRHENRWNGIRFLSASNSSRLEYCHLKHGLATGSGDDVNGGAIYCSSSGPTIRNCLIDSCEANSEGGGIYCTSSSPVIDSTTIRGNSAGNGGGIYCESNSSPTISGNSISGNSASYCGGIYCSGSNPTISGNTISGNSASYCGVIYCYSSSPTISGNTICENSASYYGGGIFCYYNSSPTISGNTISGNSASNGGGIFCYYNSSPTISGNTISGNSAGYGGGICCETSNPIISGNTISGNSASNGGGISCYNSSSPTISGNTISGNSANYGGGIYCDNNSSPAITGNTISGNSITYGYGGGIYCDNNSSPAITGNTISGNSAASGGGIYCDGGSNPVIDLNEICQNVTTGDGGGIYLSSSSPAMNKNTIVDNTATTGGGLYSYDSSPVLRNCILWGNNPYQQIRQVYASNVQVTYSDLLSFWPGVGNIFVYPLFVNPALSDYHLLCSSPCIDTGDPNPIYSDPDGTRADMGCYYFDGWTSLPVLVTWMDGDMLRLAWQPSCLAASYNVLYASEPFPALWSPLTTTTDTTITDPIGVAEKRFYQVRAYRESADLLWRATTQYYSETANLDSIVTSLFGPGYRLADWNDLVAYSQIHDIVAWADSIGMLNGYPNGFLVTCNGDHFWNGGNRHYWIDRHDHVVPPGWLVHADIDNHFIDLGSWYDMWLRILCIRVN